MPLDPEQAEAIANTLAAKLAERTAQKLERPADGEL
jgi:hypothetical protein